MKICIISSQIQGFGKVGGFGSMTRTLAVALADAGHQVSVVVPRRPKQQAVEMISGVTVYGLHRRQLLSTSIYKQIDADIYHSQNPNLLSWIAQLVEPNKQHVVTCRDPRSWSDWLIEFYYSTWRRRWENLSVYFFEASWPINWAIKNADAVGVPAHYLKQKVTNLYGIKKVLFLPNLLHIPAAPKKDATPTICMVNRLDKRKRPELLFGIAAKLPQYNFIMIGASEEKARHRQLKKMAKRFPNIEFSGALDADDIATVYGRSWILLNTAAREGLPLTFIEAAAYRCAIVSQSNPDNFASEFGYWAKKGDFVAGISQLVESKSWKEKGQVGFEYVASTYEFDEALQQHETLYQRLLADNAK